MSEAFNLLRRVRSLDIAPELSGYSGVVIFAGQDDDGNNIEYRAGDRTGTVLEITNEWGSQAQADAIYRKIRGFKYQPYKAGGTSIDPSAEIGDAVTVSDIYSGVFAKKTTFGRHIRTDLEAPSKEEVEQLNAAEKIYATDLFVLQQSGSAKKLPGQVLLNWLTAAADGHGGIQSIAKLSTSGLADTYRITLADTTIFDFVVTNGRGITGISKTSTSGLVDTYTISYNNGTTSKFTVTNGAKGNKGDNAYIWIKYASQEPTASSHSMGDIPDDWIGIYSGNASTAPTDWQQYKWCKIKGEKGNTGAPATLASKSVTYQVSGSGTIIPSGAWGSSIPVVSQGKYLWTKTELQFNTGDPIISYSVGRMGMDGTGAVSSVAGVSPDATGNVTLTAADVGALPVSGGDMTGAINMNGQPISGLNDPTEDTQAANKGYVDSRAATAVSVTITAAGWVGSGPYTQTVTVAGLTEGRRCMVYPAYGDDTDANIAMREACGCLSYAKRAGQNVTFTCLEDKPAVDVSIIVELYV